VLGRIEKQHPLICMDRFFEQLPGIQFLRELMGLLQ